MRRYRFLIPLFALALLVPLFAQREQPSVVTASPGAITVREPAYGLPHIFADTDLELAREAGREAAKDRLGQLILLSRVGRGTLFQAFGLLEPSTFNDDFEVRRDGYTSSELNNMFEKLPATERDMVLEYAKGVNDTIEAIYAGELPEPAEVNLLRTIGLEADLFGNATNISDQVDPYYLAPGGDDPERPTAGFQFTPELAMAVAMLEVRNFGSESFGEASRLTELNNLVDQLGTTTGTEIWDDLNFLNDPLAPVSVPDSSAPGFGGPLARRAAQERDLPELTDAFPDYDYDAALETVQQRQAHREEFARRLGAWPTLGSYAWMIDGDRSATGNPWVGGFPQTGIQTPSIMHYLELRSAEGTDHRVQVSGMAFVGAPIVLIGQTDDVAWTSTTAQLKNNDFYLDKVVLEDADGLRYNDEGTPAPMSMRTDQIKATDGSTTPVVVWRTHERAGNGGSRTVEAFQGDATGLVESATSESLTDTGAFSGGYGGGYVAIIGGTGAGQIRPILSNTSDTLTLDTGTGSAWSTTPDDTSEYVAVQSGNDIVAISRERAFWLEESTTALGFALFDRAESVLDIRRGTRLMPSTHNFLSADNEAFNGIGTDLGSGTGNIGYYSGGFSRVRQGGTDPRLPMDGTVANELVLLSGTVESAGDNTLTDTGVFAGEDLSPPTHNFRLDNPSQQGSEYIVTITGGTGYKQTRRIASNTDDTLTLEEDWGVVPQAGDLFEVYEIVAMPEAINPAAGYTANWNNKAATADDGSTFGRQHRGIFILERLQADTSWTRDDQRQLNKDVAGLDGKGKFGRYLVPRLREAVDASCSGGSEETVVAALETHNGDPFYGRGFVDPVNDTTVAGELAFLDSLISHLSSDIYDDEFAGSGVNPPGGLHGLDMVQHAIDSAAADVTGAYTQSYSGDYFNATAWEDVVCGSLSDTITALGGIPADSARDVRTYVHPLSALFPKLSFDTTLVGNRGTYEQIVEVGPTVLGEFVFPLGQSGFLDDVGVPDRHADSLHDTWADWRFVPMLHIAEDLATDPDGDLDDDGILDGFEKWYFGSNAPLPTDDFDSDGLNLLGEFLAGFDPTDPDTNDNGTDDGPEDTDEDGCSNQQEAGTDPSAGGLRDPLLFWDFANLLAGDPPTRDGAVFGADISAVVMRFGAHDDGAGTFNRVSDPLSTPNPVTGDNRENYHPNYDRTPLGPNPWNLGPPDGGVFGSDISNVVFQFGDDCSGM